MTKDQLLTVIIRALPYAEHIADLDTGSSPDHIYFTWRSTRYRVKVDSMFCETIEGTFACGSDLSILVEALIKRTYTAIYAELERIGKPKNPQVVKDEITP